MCETQHARNTNATQTPTHLRIASQSLMRKLLGGADPLCCIEGSIPPQTRRVSVLSSLSDAASSRAITRGNPLHASLDSILFGERGIKRVQIDELKKNKKKNSKAPH